MIPVDEDMNILICIPLLSLPIRNVQCRFWCEEKKKR